MEGHLHKFLKQIVGRELQNQNYTIHYEPLESPFSQLWLHSYRPDILAKLSCNFNLKITLVECETKPNRKRILRKTAKIQKNLSLQKRLLENTSILPLLVVPPVNLYEIICSAIRRFWEIWIINWTGEILHKICRNNKGCQIFK
jgi:hypothetical protein